MHYPLGGRGGAEGFETASGMPGQDEVTARGAVSGMASDNIEEGNEERSGARRGVARGVTRGMGRRMGRRIVRTEAALSGASEVGDGGRRREGAVGCCSM